MIIAVVQARMSSKRLPGKAMAPLRGEPMIWRQIERLRGARCLTRTIVATSIDQSDDALAAWLVSRGQPVFRGAPTDLLDRFARCVAAAGPVSHVVRIKGDAPFVDPGLVDEAVRLALASRAAWVGVQGYPKGAGAEVVTTAALNAAAAIARDPLERVSPTAWIRSRPHHFAQGRVKSGRDNSRLDWRVKTAADMAFAAGVYDALHPADPAFSVGDVMDLIGGRQDLARFTVAA